MKRSVSFLLYMILSIIALGQSRGELLGQINGTSTELIQNEVVATNLPEEKFNSNEDFIMNYVQYPEESVKSEYKGTKIVQLIFAANICFCLYCLLLGAKELKKLFGLMSPPRVT